MTRRRTAFARLQVTFAALLALSLAPSTAGAFEAFDGRLQLHGFFESQMRVISANYGEQWDMTQWYNILNLELELDLLEDVGPPQPGAGLRTHRRALRLRVLAQLRHHEARQHLRRPLPEPAATPQQRQAL